jgi:soluble P-type ATPase
MKVTNNSKALQGVHTANGVVYVKPGESKELELTADGRQLASRHSFLKVSGDVPEASGDEKADLMAKLKALGINASANSKPETLRAKLEEAEAAKAAAEAEEAAKADLIAELKGLNAEVDEKASLEDLQAALAKAKA